MRDERTEGRDRKAEVEPAVRGPLAQKDELNREEASGNGSNHTATRRGSSSERSER